MSDYLNVINKRLITVEEKHYIYEQMVWPRYAVKVSSYTNSPIRAQESSRLLPFQVQTAITDEMRGREEDPFTDTHTQHVSFGISSALKWGSNT